MAEHDGLPVQVLLWVPQGEHRDYAAAFESEVIGKGGTHPMLLSTDDASDEQLAMLDITPRPGYRLVRLYGRAVPRPGVDPFTFQIDEG